MKKAVLSLTRASGLSRLARAATARHLRVLCYHGLWVTPGFQYGDRLFMPPEQFERRMERLARSGRPVLGLEEAVEALARDRLPAGAVVITIDDGWASTYSHMLPVLERLKLPATVYVTTWYVEHQLAIVGKTVDYLLQATNAAGIDVDGRQTPLGSIAEREALAQRIAAGIDALSTIDARAQALRSLSTNLGIDPDLWSGTRQFHLMTAADVADAARRGFDIQLHTHRHIDVNAAIDRLADEVSVNREKLSAIVGGRQAHFCYPSGTYHPRADMVLESLAVRSATLVEQGLNAPQANPYRLRRFLDGRSVSDAEFDAYLDGVLEYTDAAQRLVRSWSGKRGVDA
jgi:peptidoglycan/xylan/chitin deacetylase (PgdA/CDA1 family)